MPNDRLTEQEIDIFVCGIRIQKILDGLPEGECVPRYTKVSFDKIDIFPKGIMIGLHTREEIPLKTFKGYMFWRKAYNWLGEGWRINGEMGGEWRNPDQEEPRNEILFRKYEIE